MEAYPMRLRVRIIELYDQGKQTHEIAQMLGTCESGTRRIRQLLRETKDAGADPAQDRAQKRSHRRTCCTTASIGGRGSGCDTRGATRSHESLGRCSHHRKMARRAGTGFKKKSLHAAEQDRADVKELRDDWHEQLKDIDPKRLVFIDESGAKTNMTRTPRGRAPKGERVVEHVPHGHWQTTTMLCAIRSTGPCAAAVVSGATDTDVFVGYVQHVLVPELKPGDVVILDNLQPHKAAAVGEMIRAVGAELLYLPPYSPDFHPIENMWSKVKQYLRSAAARTFDALLAAIDAALANISKSDCVGFFRNCGYAAI